MILCRLTKDCSSFCFHYVHRLLIRILPPDESKSYIKLGKKFGVHREDIDPLLLLAFELELDVIGVRYVYAQSSNISKR